MKKLIIILIMFFALLQLAPAAPPAAPPDADSTDDTTAPWSGGVEMAATNKYLWRGIEINKGFIIQPLAWLSYQNLTFSLWSSWTLSEPVDDIKRPEVDATVSYELSLQDLTIESYFSYYHYIDQPDAPNTGELGCNLGYPLGIFTLNAGIIVDVLEYSGAVYLEQKIEAEQELSESATVYGALTLGSGLKKFNESYFELPKSTISLLTVEGRFTYYMTESLYLQPLLQYNKTIDTKLYDFIRKDNSCICLTIGTEF
jgi:hypothetical protein